MAETGVIHQTVKMHLNVTIGTDSKPRFEGRSADWIQGFAAGQLSVAGKRYTDVEDWHGKATSAG
jgi:hypothetical protein